MLLVNASRTAITDSHKTVAVTSYPGRGIVPLQVSPQERLGRTPVRGEGGRSSRPVDYRKPSCPDRGVYRTDLSRYPM
jgi:hypothetical protein